MLNDSGDGGRGAAGLKPNVICFFQCYVLVTCYMIEIDYCRYHGLRTPVPGLPVTFYMLHDSGDGGRGAVAGLELNVICSFRLLHFMPSSQTAPANRTL